MTDRPDDLPERPLDGAHERARGELRQGVHEGDDFAAHDDTGDELLDEALLADLRRAWSELPVPEASPALDDADPLTRAAVAWMRDAYAAQQPTLVGPSLPLRQRWRLGWRRWRREAVAAVLLLGLGLAVAQWPDPVRRPADDPARGDSLAGGGTTPAPGERPADGRPSTDEPAGDPALEAPPRPDPAAPRLVAVADDHISFRAGAVRLVLLTNPESAD